ncbi:Mss4-like protein [Aspergillus unguis]
MASNTLNGACLCGTITYKIDIPASEPTPKIAICHCTSCKKYTGGPFSTNLIIPQSWITYTSGKPKVMSDKSTDSGNPLPREFCGDCGCHFTSSPDAAPWTALKWGTLDEESRKKTSELGGEIYCKRKDGWVDELAGGVKGGFREEAGM